MKVYWNNEYTAAQSMLRLTAKTQAIAERLRSHPVDNAQLVDPKSPFVSDGRTWESSFSEVALEHIRKVHTEKYVDAVRTGTPKGLAKSSGFEWEPSVFNTAVAHTTGLMAAVHHVMQNGGTAGSLSTGSSHARSDKGSRSCVFNGLAAAVSYAITGWNAKKILILDVEAEYGGGTDGIIASNFPDRVVHIDISTKANDAYEERDGNVKKKVNRMAYSVVTEMAVQRVFSDHTFDLVIYNAGVNPVHSKVERAELVEREKFVRAYIEDTPAVFVLGGGVPGGNYTMDDIVDLHLLTISEWAKYEKVAQ